MAYKEIRVEYLEHLLDNDIIALTDETVKKGDCVEFLFKNTKYWGYVKYKDTVHLTRIEIEATETY